MKSLSAVVKGIVDYRLDNLHTSLPAQVVDYDAATQTATLRVMLFRTVDKDNVTGKEYPLLSKIPVHFPRAGGMSITLPVAPDDDCMVFFSEILYKIRLI